MNTPVAHFDISPTFDWVGRMIAGHPRFWISAGNLETALLAIDDTPPHKPVYICGLARSGSTVLLETLAAQPGIVTHQYRDFPFLFTPYWWSTLCKILPKRSHPKRERAHGDSILIDVNSPEAMEEMLWMAFFPHLHRMQPEVLDAGTHNPDFAAFYRAHIQKLLMLRKGQRYVSKGNYTITRMEYLQSLFPDARFIVPVRDPVTHIASLMRQHDRFSRAEGENPRITRHMSLMGHFEFGLTRTPIHIGDAERMSAITNAWQRGEEVHGWALYWGAIYRFLYTRLAAQPLLNQQTLIVRFEDLCANAAPTLRTIFHHSAVTVPEPEIKRLSASFRTPDYYSSTLTDTEIALIKKLTGDTARLFGY
jgi:hypothetical protein